MTGGQQLGSVAVQMRHALSATLDSIPEARNGGMRRAQTATRALPPLQEPLLPELHLVRPICIPGVVNAGLLEQLHPGDVALLAGGTSLMRSLSPCDADASHQCCGTLLLPNAVTLCGSR